MSQIMSAAASRPGIIDAIVRAQAANGAFRSFVASGGRVLEDHNACITSLAVRAIGHGPQPRPLHDARTRALDYLERCERSTAPGTYGFWGENDRPAWAPNLPADADDTSLIALELFRSKRRSLDWLRRVALLTLLRFRVGEAEDHPAWVRAGVFRTWLADRRPNPVDCVVNVNVAALLAVAGLTHLAAYRAVLSMLESALETADGPAQVARLSPFYAHPIELRWALTHAVASGAYELQPALDGVRRCGIDGTGPIGDRPICCSAYGVRRWSAPVLQLLRGLAPAVDPPRDAGRTFPCRRPRACGDRGRPAPGRSGQTLNRT